LILNTAVTLINTKPYHMKGFLLGYVFNLSETK